MSNVIQIRPFCEDDCARCVEIANLSRPESAIAEDRLRQDDAQWDASRYFQVRLVAEDAGGRAVGWGQIGHTPWQYEPHKQELVLRVDPAYQRQGFGSALYEHLLIEASAHGARVIRSAVFETHPEGIEFLTHRGFTELQRMWRSRLDVDAFDDSRFDGAEERVRAQGIAITTLAAERQLNEDAVRKAYELRSTCFATVPSLDPLTPLPYDMFVRASMDAADALPDAHFLAKDGERYVGETCLVHMPQRTVRLHHAFTGVLPEYRGRGIALALKLQAVRYARERGERFISTGNHSQNRPMLAINEALGFQKQLTMIEFVKRL